MPIRNLLTALFIPKGIINILLNVCITFFILLDSVLQAMAFIFSYLLLFFNQIYHFPLFFTFLVFLSFLVRKISPFNLLL
jgi:hypothetical protein